ncbi:TlpA disulfide reductase family protein [Hymenobacter sp. BT190]|uniref:TlpA disulfide reductase family protein n=1 Tax=Hymenobacter sp. BT190 TaxID=2763505 RepID=UPI0016515C55|nr:TlpA disulfide reductase family protein [Hymenobacter sp. BT190]MBC6699376.1 AhpC/TSA family protein [Hymenobacter sp. BT190]
MLKMKSLLIVGTVLGMANACTKNTPPTAGTADAAAGYQLSGQLTNAPAGTKLYLAELGETQFISRDTVTLDEKGNFRFTGTVPEPGLYQVKTTDQSQVLLALSNGSRVELSGDAQKLAETYTVKGSKDSELLQQLNRTMQQSKGQMSGLEARYNQNAAANRTDSMQAIEKMFYDAQARSTKSIKTLVQQNPKSVVSAFVVANLINAEEQFGFVDSMTTQFKTTLPDSRYTKALTAKIEPMRSTAVGAAAPEISLLAPDGKPLPLSSLRGKYVLVDFWASWCGPCRRENPNVVRAYNKYKGKGFEIYGVSFDQDRSKWLKAIEADGLTWKHVSDLKGWESAAGQTYSVKSIPASVLLDPQGRIIGKNLRGEALEAKLASVLK